MKTSPVGQEAVLELQLKKVEAEKKVEAKPGFNPQRLRPGGESVGERGKTHPRLTLLTLDGSQARWPQAADLSKASG